MIKEVKYKGYSANPSDYECEDGELALNLNAIYENGSVRPILRPELVGRFPDSNVLCVHKLTDGINYIYVKNNLLYTQCDNTSKIIADYTDTGIEVFQATPIGNTLVVSTSDGIYYFLWKEGGYIALGNELPELNVRPYISTNLMNTTTLIEAYGVRMNHSENGVVISGDDMIYADLCKQMSVEIINTITLGGSEKQNVYQKVFSLLNYQSHFLKEEGYFLEPFYVRFAFRMFDGSHVRHTVPVLMVPTTWGKPFMNVKITDSKAIFDPIYSCSKLYADIVVSDNLDDWKDIITDIDVFVTEPLIDYSDSPESLLAVKKYPWNDNDDVRIPMSMVTTEDESGDFVTVWSKIPDYVESLNQKGFVIVPWNIMTFKKNNTLLGGDKNGYYHGKIGGLTDVKGYIAIENKGYTIKASNLLGQQGVAEIHDLEWFKTSLDLTIFNVEDVKNVDIYTTSEELNSDEVEMRVFLIWGPLKDLNTSYYIETKRVDGKNYNEVLTGYSSFYKVAELNVSEVCNGFSGMIQIKDRALVNIVVNQTLSDLGEQHNTFTSSNILNYNSRLNVILDKEKINNPSISLIMQNPARLSVSYFKINKAYVEIYENSQYAYVEIPVGEDMSLENLMMFSFPHNNAKNLFVLYEYNNQKYTSSIPLKRHDFLNLSYAFNDFKTLKTVGEKMLMGESEFIIPSNDTIKYGNIIRLSDVNNPFRFSEEYAVSLPVQKIYALSTAAKALSQGQFGQYPLYAFTSEGIWALELTATGTYSARQPISRDVVINTDSITQIDSAVLFATDRGIMLISGSKVMCISDTINSYDLFSLSHLPKSQQLLDIYNSESASNIALSDISMIPFGDFLKKCRMIYDYTHQHIIVYNPEVRYAYVYSLLSQTWGMIHSKITAGISSYPEALAMEGGNLVDFSQEYGRESHVLIITRPIKLERDIYKTINTIVQRGDCDTKNIKQVLYGSNDNTNWFLVWSGNGGYMGGFRGTPYKYYRLAIVKTLRNSECMHGISLQYENRLTNRLR